MDGNGQDFIILADMVISGGSILDSSAETSSGINKKVDMINNETIINETLIPLHSMVFHRDCILIGLLNQLVLKSRSQGPIKGIEPWTFKNKRKTK
jgi:hypothetical protein